MLVQRRSKVYLIKPQIWPLGEGLEPECASLKISSSNPTSANKYCIGLVHTKLALIGLDPH